MLGAVKPTSLLARTTTAKAKSSCPHPSIKEPQTTPPSCGSTGAGGGGGGLGPVLVCDPPHPPTPEFCNIAVQGPNFLSYA